MCGGKGYFVNDFSRTKTVAVKEPHLLQKPLKTTLLKFVQDRLADGLCAICGKLSEEGRRCDDCKSRIGWASQTWENTIL